MNWKIEAIEKLKMYEAKRQALQSIPEEAARLKSSMSSIRSASADSSPVTGGGSGREDMMLSNIVQREELRRSYTQAKRWVAAVEGALGVLTKEERLILDRFYITPEKNAADRLAGELLIDVKTVYRRKDAALRKFTVALYGEIEN